MAFLLVSSVSATPPVIGEFRIELVPQAESPVRFTMAVSEVGFGHYSLYGKADTLDSSESTNTSVASGVARTTDDNLFLSIQENHVKADNLITDRYHVTFPFPYENGQFSGTSRNINGEIPLAGSAFLNPGCTPFDANQLDLDGDGYTQNQGDCNDLDAMFNPGAYEILDDGIDQNRNTFSEVSNPGSVYFTFSTNNSSYNFDGIKVDSLIFYAQRTDGTLTEFVLGSQQISSASTYSAVVNAIKQYISDTYGGMFHASLLFESSQPWIKINSPTASNCYARFLMQGAESMTSLCQGAL